MTKYIRDKMYSDSTGVSQKDPIKKSKKVNKNKLNQDLPDDNPNIGDDRGDRDMSQGVPQVSVGENMFYSWRDDFPNYDLLEQMIYEDWQSVNRKDKTDGMSKAAVDEYRRQYKGSKLQTAVTEKNPTGKRAARRASFCRRMSGMKSKLTSKETARDPDSRINKALRRWNCN